MANGCRFATELLRALPSLVVTWVCFEGNSKTKDDR